MTEEQLKNYLSSRYQGAQSFLENVFFPIFGEDEWEDGLNLDMLQRYPDLRLQAQETGIVAFNYVGQKMVDVEPLEVFDITVGDHAMLERNRVGVQRLVRRVMDVYSSAFMIFHYQDDGRWEWRFSFCHKEASATETTNAKRYTFLLGPGQSCRTATQNFMQLANRHGEIDYEAIKKAFDVEALSKEFFDKYKLHYEGFVEYITGKRYVKKNSKWVEKKMHEPHEQMYPAFGCDDKMVRDYIKKMMGRIVFLHFLQKKGWMGVPADKSWGEGDTQFMKHLYDNASDEQKDDFLDVVLEPLFSALDTDRADEHYLYDTRSMGQLKVPYLNGGLFVRDSLDEIDTKFPRKMFEDFLEFLYQYNFTIDENGPDDAQLGIDPEMLGRIFENLLEDNKDKGAYYTPKPIVQYMCRESLKAYLQTDYTDEETRKKISDFVETYNVEILGGEDSKLAKEIDKLLFDVKICDPAIGSGAFPMGLLREIFYCRGAIEHFENPAEIKRHIIQQNVYGVDIERGAVDIARLRFWLSLIIDETSPETLPNLDFKFMQGNSLLESYQGVDLSTISPQKIKSGTQLNIFNDNLEIYRHELQMFLDKFYNCDDHNQRKNLLQLIAKNVKHQLNEQCAQVDLSNIDIHANTEFFLWHTWFSDVFSRPSKEGFDIVIANPPYKVELIENWPGFEWTGNLFLLFFEFCMRELMYDKTILSFITPLYYLLNLDTKEMRKELLTKWNIMFLSRTSPFEAITENIITQIKKGAPESEYIPVYKDNDAHIFSPYNKVKISYCLKNPNYEITFNLKEDLIELLDKIKSGSDVLATYIKSKRGAEVSKKVIRAQNGGLPALIGNDVQKFQVNWNNTFLPENHKEAKRLKKHFYSNNIVFLRRVDDSLTAAVSDDKFIANKNIYGLVVDDNVPNEYICLLLNSKLLNFYYRNRFSFKKEDVFPEIQTYLYEQLPIRLPKDYTIAKDIYQSYDASEDWQNIYDKYVFKLYGLTYEEVLIVDPETPITREEYERN